MMVIRGSLAAAHQGIPATQIHLFQRTRSCGDRHTIPTLDTKPKEPTSSQVTKTQFKSRTRS